MHRHARLVRSSAPIAALALALGIAAPMAQAQQITQGGGNTTGGIAGGGGGRGSGAGGSAATTPGGSAEAGTAGSDNSGTGGAGGAPGTPNDLTAGGGGGGGGASDSPTAPGNGANGGAGGSGTLSAVTGPVSFDSAIAGSSGSAGSGGTGANAGSGGGGGGGGGLVLTGTGVQATVSNNVTGGAGGNSGGGTGGDGGIGGGGGAGLVLLNGGTVTVAGGAASTIAGGGGGGGGAGGAGVFLYQGGALDLQAGTVMGGDGGTRGGGIAGSAGAGVLSNLGTIGNQGTIAGGAGGRGFGGASGGDGGAGVVAWGGSIVNAATGVITGGKGGDNRTSLFGSTAGDGGAGVQFQNGQAGSLFNAGMIQGGARGESPEVPALGHAGVGVVGAASGGISIVNAGTITGGTGITNLGPAVMANAISLFGSNNRLELRLGSTITGNVVASGGANNALALGGASDATFNVSQIGATQQYRGFDIFEKTGSSAWTLTGAGNQDWSVVDGVLKGDTNSLAGNVTFASGAGSRGVVFDQAVDGVSAGTISGDGALSKAGTGMVTLTGTNTYTGGTTITGGVLQLGNGGTTGSIIGDVANNGTLSFNRSDAYTFAGQISGNGQIRQAGGGTTTLSGNSAGFTGATEVGAGNLSVNGTLGGAISVMSGGTLGGNGVVGSTTVNGGTLSPGNSIGLLTVNGSLTLTAASSYLVEVSPANADRVNVTGKATLGGATVNASFAPGSYVAKQYTILHADDGVNGTFAGPANSDLPSNFTSTLSYDGNNAFLNLALAFHLPTGLNDNQQNVADALINFFDRTGGIPLAFGSLTPAGLTQASGEAATGSQQTTFDAMNLFIGVLTDPFVAGRGDPGASSGGAAGYAADDNDALAYAGGRERSSAEREAYAAVHPKSQVYEPRWSVWAAGFGGSQTTDGNGALGSNTATSRIAGAATGADYWFSPYTVAGFALAGGGTNFSVANGGTGRSDLFQAGAFVHHNIGPAYITGALAYGWQDITTDRSIGADHLQARFNANAYSGRVEGGYRVVAPWTGGIGLAPYAAGQVTTFDLPAYAEQAIAGGNTFALGYASKSVTATRSELGLRADKSFALNDATLTLRGRAAWAHNFDPDRSISATFQALPGASFVVNGAAQARDAALTTASAEVKFANGLAFAATFEGEFSGVTASYAGKGTLRYAW
ncbi:autotransporter domain-containing protein [Mesorhizobium sp. B1-1-8]|uniref:autotransporter outer membrane beta-barrel domain-containing protein n=1 Tax=Mesorhizobium sp. B1-1-8 TaxID=2589976 RepID=UPI001D0026B8|nr:autotransporter outer membrane beta-barrel domain-containing protein [Mesorhizobium sp. B1-1-8]UCI06863.1 autotransporter domain-containing protein [Mesorhizobium sp. B1-1-8]